MIDKIDSWCSQLASLRKIGPAEWTASGHTQVSFPIEAQGDLALIEEDSYWFRHRNEIITSIVRAFPPEGPIIDIGGGNGFVSKALIECGFPALVIEPGPLAVSKCKQRAVPVAQAAFQDLDVPPASTHAVGMFDVLEHIYDDVAVLKEIHSILRPTGRFYIAVPAYQWLWSREDTEGGHFRRYTLATLRSKLEATGFTVEFETYMFAALLLPLLLLRAIPTKLGLRKEVNIEQSAKEHTLPANYFGEILSRSLAQEMRKIQSGQTVTYGTSCLVVARRK